MFSALPATTSDHFSAENFVFNHNLSPCTCLFCLITFLIGEMYWYCSEISKYQLNKMVHAPAAHPGFKSRKCYSPWMRQQSIAKLPHHHFRLSLQFANTYLYSGLERSTVKVNCFSREHIIMTQPGLDPRPLNIESSLLTTTPPHLPLIL